MCLLGLGTGLRRRDQAQVSREGLSPGRLWQLQSMAWGAPVQRGCCGYAAVNACHDPIACGVLHPARHILGCAEASCRAHIWSLLPHARCYHAVVAHMLVCAHLLVYALLVCAHAGACAAGVCMCIAGVCICTASNSMRLPWCSRVLKRWLAWPTSFCGVEEFCSGGSAMVCSVVMPITWYGGFCNRRAAQAELMASSRPHDGCVCSQRASLLPLTTLGIWLLQLQLLAVTGMPWQRLDKPACAAQLMASGYRLIATIHPRAAWMLNFRTELPAC